MSRSEMNRLFSGEKVAFFGDEHGTYPPEQCAGPGDGYPMECPECGCKDDLSWDVVATVRSWDGRPCTYWTAWEHFNARCYECHHESTVAKFMKQDNQEEE